MIKYIKHTILALVVILTACADDKQRMPEQPDPSTPAPTVLSSTPNENETKVIAGIIPIKIAFDQNIKLLDLNHGIKINGQDVVRADAIGTELRIVAMTEENVSYTITIPSGLIANAAENATGELTLSFETVNRNISSNLVNTNATDAAKKVYTYLRETARNKTLSATMAEVNWNTLNAEQVNTWTGKYPAMNTFDYVHLPFSPADWIDYSDVSPVKNWWTAGGLVSIMWHWNVPTGYLEPLETVVSTKETIIPGDWSGSLQLTQNGEFDLAVFANAVVGMKIRVEMKDVVGGAQGSLKNSSWGELYAGSDYFDVSGDYYETLITEDILAEIQANGFIISGHDYTLTAVKLIGGPTDEYAFYKDQTTFDAANATVSGKWENEVFMADLAKVADLLLKLQDENIPVIWRPFHEAAGGWFWWGKDADSFRTLWIAMFDYFKAQGVNNLIWVYTAEPGDSDWYPGNAYVDIIGRDLYEKDAASCLNEYNALNDVQYAEKIIALTECGSVGLISAQWEAGARWAWFMPWYNDGESVHADQNWWTDAMNLEYVVSREDLPEF